MVDNLDSLTGLRVTMNRVSLDVDTASGELRRIFHPTTLTIDATRPSPDAPRDPSPDASRGPGATRPADSSAARTRQNTTASRPPCSVTAVVGANGSGKSTLLRLLAGLENPTGGTISYTPRAPRCGFIFANPQAQIIMPVVGEDIDFSLRKLITNKRQRSARVAEILDSLHLGHRAQSSVYELSSGERQKVALAGVLATDPEWVIADEPTTLLDLRNADEFQRRLLNLGVPLIFATHDLQFAQRADRVLVFDQGHVVFDGDPTEGISTYRVRELGGS